MSQPTALSPMCSSLHCAQGGQKAKVLFQRQSKHLFTIWSKKKKKYIQMWKLPLFFAPSSKEQVVLLLFLPRSWQLLSSHGKCSKLKGALVYRRKKNLSKELKRCLKVYSHAFTQPPPVSWITCMHCSPVNPSFWIQCRSGGLNCCIEKW